MSGSIRTLDLFTVVEYELCLRQYSSTTTQIDTHVSQEAQSRIISPFDIGVNPRLGIYELTRILNFKRGVFRLPIRAS